MDYETEIIALKTTQERHSDRITLLEKRHSEDHEVLKAVKTDVESIKADNVEIKKDINQIKAQGAATAHAITTLTKWLKVIGVVATITFIFVVIKNEQIASNIALLVTSTVPRIL